MDIFQDLFLRPRKDTSIEKRSSQLPPDILQMINEVLKEEILVKYPQFTPHSTGIIYPEELTFTLMLSEKGSLRPINFAASLDFDIEQTKENTKYMMDLIELAVDAVGSFAEQYLEAEGDIEVPLDWHSFDLETNKIYLRFHTKNDSLEAQANALLGTLDEENSDWESLGEEYFAEARERLQNGENEELH